MGANVVIIDYGMGNVSSIEKAFRRLRIPARISCDPHILSVATHLILPGVGHFREGIRSLNERGILPQLTDLVRIKKIPILGICLGMQLLTRSSEEGDCEGLGFIAVKTKRFPESGGFPRLAIPHVHRGFHER